VAGPYRQQLPELDLALEHQTDRCPDPRGWFIFRGEELVGRYPSQNAAREAWGELIEQSGWQPRKRELDAKETLLREARERWARNRGG
jgi:hypothetical protein